MVAWGPEGCEKSRRTPGGSVGAQRAICCCLLRFTYASTVSCETCLGRGKRVAMV